MDSFASHADEILPGLFLGSEDSGAVPLAELERRNMCRILMPAKTGREAIVHADAMQLQYLQYNIPDVAGFPLLPLLEEFCEFIDEGRSEGRAVLVHCAAGKSRNASVVVAYLMWKEDICFSEAYQRVREKRRAVSLKFEEQLRQWEDRKANPDMGTRHPFCKKPLFASKQKQGSKEG